MPKYTCEMDTDAKTVKMMKDGQEVSCMDMSMGSYEMPMDMQSKDMQKRCYVSFSQKANNDTVVTTSVAFSTMDQEEMDDMEMGSNVLRDIGRVIKMDTAAKKLKKALCKKKKC